ncbi:MAG: HlyD family type I secretion periplasmic adaptor subunit [Rhodoferax sp.]|uniref:HlyD family type I secretion periplasmic adaptor subunit n=1 Tax=Rhodoferax sp. TaxID=50421 RepID=UPI00273448FE|nr:HlyD family type I secretion periplasmic adaptor subunit [Rhodoferax sp.]MDP2678540.1 HlyD family type I secretion periplasmic adaptor subunit [Rhodoferax sp.]
MFTNLQARLKNWIQRYAGTEATTVAGSAKDVGQINRASLFMLWSVTGFFVVMFIWIAVAEVDNVTRADGRVIPSAKMQVIQNFEGGIVTEILVKQGQSVQAGDRLVALSAVQHDGDMKARQQQMLGLEARAARLAALASSKSPVFSPQLKATAPELVAVETASYLSKKLEQESQVSVLDAQIEQKRRELEESRISLQATQKSLALGREERATVARLVERGLEPRLELVRIDRSFAEQEGRVNAATVAIGRMLSAVNEISARKDAMVRQFRSEALNELNRTLADLAPLKESMPALQDKVSRTEIKAPMKGIVNRVFVTTLGGTVRPGDPIVEVVPGDDDLVVEALVNPKDIGFVKLGQLARVKITAYDYSIFGSMEGTVESISADAVPNEKGEAFFQVRITTKTKAIEAIDKKLPIMPGMQAQIDIITGKKTILQFLSKPIVAVKENAFRER